MSVLNPVALWLLLLVPVVFLARRRPKRLRVPVANLYLWTAATASGTSALTRRFRRHRLFLLQALVLVALILALARPLFTSGARSVVIVDASLSMSARDGSRTRLEDAKTKAVTYVDGLPWTDRVRVIAALSSPKDFGEFRASDPGLRRALTAIGPSVGAGDLAAAIQLAQSTDTPPDHIEVFSDLLSPAPPGISSDVGWSVIGGPGDNVAITALGVRRGPPTARASAAITNYSRVAISRTVVFEQGDRTLARERVDIAPGRTQTLSAAIDVTEGALSARIDGDDALPEDNQRWAAVPPAKRVRVLLTGSSFFIEQALRAHPDVDLRTGSAAGADDVIVCAGCSSLPEGNANVLLIPRPLDSQQPVPMTLRAVDHPLVDGLGLTDLSVTPVAHLGETKAGEVVTSVGDLPAIVADASGARRIVEWRFDVSGGPLTLSPAFPLLVANAIEWLAPAAAAPNQGFVNPETTNESDLRVRLAASVPSLLAEPHRSGRNQRGRSEITVLLLILALGALLMEWRLRRATMGHVGRAATVSHMAVAALLMLAAIGLQIPGGRAPLSVMYVLDRSASVSGSESDSLDRLRKQSASMQSGDRAGLVVFGADAVVERGLTETFRPQAISAVTSPTGTDIEAALRSARMALSSAQSGRVVLLSDGRETRGSALDEARRAAAATVPIDVEDVPVAGGSATRVVQLHAPSLVNVDEPFIVTATVRGAPGSTSSVSLRSDEDMPAEQRVVLSAYGVGTASFSARSPLAGMRVYRAAARSLGSDTQGDVDGLAGQAGVAVVVSGVPRLLYVSAAPSGPASSLAASGYRVSAASQLPRSVAQLASYDAIVMDDVHADALDAAQTSALADYVERLGGGLLVLGSPRSLEPALAANAPLDRLLPIDVRPRSGQRSADLALVVIFDKSGSMDDQVAGARKIDFARQAIQRALESVSATDLVGVIAFDATAVPVAPLRAGQDSRAIGETLRSLVPGGATAIAPAAELARDWLNRAPVDQARRHVLLISDGQTSAQDAARLRDLVAAQRYTLSVVALGGDRDRQLLTSLSQSSGGQAFFPDDVRQLPVLVAREVTRVAGGRLVETPFTVRPSPHAILAGIGADPWPQLGGYVVSTARPGAETPLRSHLDDPILATWRIGLGRVGVYTADLSSRWSDGLRAWRGFDRLMGQTVRWLSRRVDDDSLSLRLQPTDEGVRLQLEAYGPDDTPLDLADVRATVRRPSGATTDVDLRGSTPGLYEASFDVSETGAHLVTIDAQSRDRAFDRHLTRGVYFSGEREHRFAESDRELLAAIARTSGGVILEPGDSPFLQPRPSAHVDARPWLVLGGVLIFFIEIALPGLLERLRARRPVVVGAGTPPGREDAA